MSGTEYKFDVKQRACETIALSQAVQTLIDEEDANSLANAHRFVMMISAAAEDIHVAATAC